MEIKIKELKKAQLTPNEYIILLSLISKNIADIFWNIGEDLVSLQKKGYVLDDEPTEKALSLFNQENYEEWVNQWMDLWPTQLMPDGYRVSGNSIAVRMRMNKFRKDFPDFTLDDIKQATINYLKDRELNNWKFIKKNAKFIYDAEGSVLEQECLSLKTKKQDKIKTNNIDI